jgi:hypothetical protein
MRIMYRKNDDGEIEVKRFGSYRRMSAWDDLPVAVMKAFGDNAEVVAYDDDSETAVVTKWASGERTYRRGGFSVRLPQSRSERLSDLRQKRRDLDREIRRRERGLRSVILEALLDD